MMIISSFFGICTAVLWIHYQCVSTQTVGVKQAGAIHC